MTSWLTPNCSAVTTVAVDHTELANETTKVMQARIMIVYHRYFLLQFWGFSGSLGPSQSTRSLRSSVGGGAGAVVFDEIGSSSWSSFSPGVAEPSSVFERSGLAVLASVIQRYRWHIRHIGVTFGLGVVRCGSIAISDRVDHCRCFGDAITGGVGLQVAIRFLDLRHDCQGKGRSNRVKRENVTLVERDQGPRTTVI